MDPRKLDTSLGILLTMSPEQLERAREEERFALGEGEDPTIGVTVRLTDPSAELPELDETHRIADVATGTVRLSELDPLSDRDAVLSIAPVLAGRILLDRTRAVTGVNVTDGQRIRAGAEPWDGTGVTIGVVDTGLDLHHPAFRQFPGGPTRVAFYWDRANAPRPGDTPHPSGIGTLYTRAQIDAELLGPAANPPVINPLAFDLREGGHGSHVTGIAASSGAGGSERFVGMAPGATIIFVCHRSFLDMGQLHTICDWIYTQAGGPCSINLSLGVEAGPHDGTADVESGLDALLRDPVSTVARGGRSMVLSAGNDWRAQFHVRSRVLPPDGPDTRLVWISRMDNFGSDLFELWMAGLDQVQVRLVQPTTPLTATAWVAPDPAGCIDLPGGGLAPLAPGVGALSKQFTFADGTVAFISQSENLVNGDRQLGFRIDPPAPPPARGITEGYWFIELRARNALPAGGEIDGYLRTDTGTANTSFLQPARTARSLVVPAHGNETLDLLVPVGTGPVPIRAAFRYAAEDRLEVQVGPAAAVAAPPSQRVAPGNAAVADAALTAPGAAGADGLPFAFGAQTVAVSHSGALGAPRVAVVTLAAPITVFGIYRVTLHNAGDRPVAVEARLDPGYGGADTCPIFRKDPFEEVDLEVLPTPALPTALALTVPPPGSTAGELELTFAGGAIDARVRMAPADPFEAAGGWAVTPWVGPGNVELAGGTIPLAGGAAGPRTYIDATRRARIEHTGPGTIRIRIDSDTALITEGEWRVELQGHGLAAPLTVRARVRNPDDAGPSLIDAPPWMLDRLFMTLVDEPSGLADRSSREPLITAQDPALAVQRVSLEALDEPAHSVPFVIPGEIGEEIRAEVLYDASQTLRVRVRPPAPHRLPFSVGPDAGADHGIVVDAGAVAPAFGAGGATAPVVAGTTVSILHPAAPAFGTTRRVLIRIASPAGHHPDGLWRIELTGTGTAVVRLDADGWAAKFLRRLPPTRDMHEGSLGTPSTAREPLCIANGDPASGALMVVPADSTSPGGVRPATEMRLNGARRWLPYAKPELMAPGEAITSALSAFVQVPDAVVTVADGTPRRPRATWPVLRETGAGARDHGRLQRRDIAAADAETTFTFVMPAEAGRRGLLAPDFHVDREVRLLVRYPADREFSLRIEQPAAAPTAPRRTRAVRRDGTEAAVAGAGVAAGTAVAPGPEGRGLSYRLGDETQVIIRQTGDGHATVLLRGPAQGDGFQGGEWRLIVRREAAFVGVAPTTVETVPRFDRGGWPRFASGDMRFTIPVGPGAPGAPLLVPFALAVPPRVAGDFTVRLTYPAPPVGAGAYSFDAHVLRTGPPPVFSRGVMTNGALAPTGGAGEVAPAGGGAPARTFNWPGTGERIRVQHAPGVVTVTFTRGANARFQIDDGQWIILLSNRGVTPAAPVNVVGEIDPAPHDAPCFRRPTTLIPYAFTEYGRLAPPAQLTWTLHVPEGRHTPLAVEVIYDARDTVRVQVEAPGGARTEPVALGNVPAAGALGATIANGGVGADGAQFTVAGQFAAFISNGAHPDTAGARSRARILLRPDGEDPLPAGDWTLRLDPTAALGAGSNGVAEAWIEEMRWQQVGGTSMAAPHVAGVAALMLQQDGTLTHEQIKARLLSTARPRAATRSGELQPPNQWDPVAGWGTLNASEALLGHAGGLEHNRGAMPEAVGRSSGTPVPDEDNQLVVLDGDELRLSRTSPPNRAGAAPLAPSARLQDYRARFHRGAFAGGPAATQRTLTSTALDQPLLRARADRNDLRAFAPVSWDAAYTAIADRLFEQWSTSGGTVLIPGLDGRVVRELLLNRFAHHLNRLLGSTNHVTKCSFTTKESVTVLGSRVPFGGPGAGAAAHGLRELLFGATPLHGRGDLSLSRAIVLWGANPRANAQALWRDVQAAMTARGERLAVLAVDPGAHELPQGVRRIAIAPGSDRSLALAVLLRLVGDPARGFDAHPVYADATRGRRRFVLSANVADFEAHVRASTAGFLRLDGTRLVPDAALLSRCLPGGDAAARERLTGDLDALVDAYVHGPAATLLGSGAGRSIEGEEDVEYIAAVALLSGNLGSAGGGVTLSADHVATFNPPAFAGAHDTRRPAENSSLGSFTDQENVNAASLAADVPTTAKVALWVDSDPLTALPDPLAVETLLARMQLNVAVVEALDDSCRFADVILPLGDSLREYDLQTGSRSAWLNLNQPIAGLGETGPRPLARILHELLARVRTKLVDSDYHDDLKPVIDEPAMKTGPLLLSRTRRGELRAFFEDANRIPNLLRDRLPAADVANIHAQLRGWYTAVHGGEPTTDTDAAVTATDPVKFFNRMQVDWLLEALLARHPERVAVQLLYNLLQRGTALDPLRHAAAAFPVLPDGVPPLADNVAMGAVIADLPVGGAFTVSHAPYRDAVRAIDAGATGRTRFPMRLVIAEDPAYHSSRIPLAAQFSGAAVALPTVHVNPASASLAALGALPAGREVAVVGNVTYRPGETFETVIARAAVQPDARMAPETVFMRPGWNGLDRGGQRVVRGVHSEEGEAPALSDNLVRLEAAGYAPAGNAAGRGTPPPKR